MYQIVLYILNLHILYIKNIFIKVEKNWVSVACLFLTLVFRVAHQTFMEHLCYDRPIMSVRDPETKKTDSQPCRAVNECSVSMYLISLYPLKVSWITPIFSIPLESFFRQRSLDRGLLCALYLFSLSHGQMGLAPLNVLFKRLWGQEQYVFISEYSLLLSGCGCSEEVLQMINLQVFVWLTLIHSVSLPSWAEEFQPGLDFRRNWLVKETLKTG